MEHAMSLQSYFFFPKTCDGAALDAIRLAETHAQDSTKLRAFLQSYLGERDGRPDEMDLLARQARIVPFDDLPPEIHEIAGAGPALVLNQEDFRDENKAVLERFRQNLVTLHVRCIDIAVWPSRTP